MLRTLHSTLVVAIACMFGVLGRPCMAQPNNQPSTAPLQSSAPTTGSGVKTAFIVQMMIIQMEDAVGAPKGELHEEVLSKIQDVTNDRELMEQLKKIRDFTILSRPQIAMAQNLAASVSIGESRAIPYMVRVDENLYRLTATKPERLGIDIAVTGSWDKEANRICLDPLEVSLYAMESRDQVAGTDFPIGKPRVTRRSVTTSLDLVPEKYDLVELSVSESKQVLVILRASVKVTEDSPKQPLPNPAPVKRS